MHGPTCIFGANLTAFSPEFLAAGADAIIANTYATNRHILAAAGMADLTERANRLGCRLALAARDEWCAAHPGEPRPVVAGSR